MKSGIRNKVIKGATFVTSSEMVAQGASFLRNIILARILTKVDFGIGTSLFLVLSLFELTAKMGISRFIVQDKEGDNPNFMASIHLAGGVTGIVSFLLIICSTPLFLNLFNISDKWWVFAILAMVPVVRGFEHVDIRRYERTLRFGPSSIAEIVPQIIITISAWPIALWLKDFRVVLILIIGKSVLSCAISHLYSTYPYQWKYNKEYIIRLWKFAWPLILTSFLIFGIIQGDQFIIATFYNMSELASYALAVSLITTISFIIGRIVSSVGLPILSEVQNDPFIFKNRYRKIMAILVLLSSATAVPMIIGAEAFIKLFFGYKYSGTGIIMAWLTGVYAFRNLRVAPTLAALAKGDSVNQFISNIFRAIAIVPIAFMAYFHQPIWLLAACGLIGEAGACWVSFVRLRNREGFPIRENLAPILFLVILLSAAGVLAWLGSHGLSILCGILISFISLICTLILSIIMLSDIRNEVFNLVKLRSSFNLVRSFTYLKTPK